MSPFPLLKLPDDVLIVVLEQLELLSKESVRSCTAVCHRLYRLGVPLVYRHVRIHNGSGVRVLYRGFAPGSQLPRFAKSVCFNDSDWDKPEPLCAWLRAASSARNLKVLKYEGQAHMSQEFLDDFHRLFPDAVLDATMEYYYSNDVVEIDNWEPCPCPRPCGISSRQLRSLMTAALWDDTDKSAQHAARCLGRTISSSPNLERLIDPSVDASAGSGWRLRGNYSQGRILSLHFDLAQPLPQLKEFAYMPLSPETIRIWGEHSEHWQRLQNLKVSNLEQLAAFGDHLPSLQHLTIASIPASDLVSFQGPRASLVSLYILRLDDALVPTRLLSMYAQTLLELSIQLKDSWPRVKSPGAGLCGSQLADINAACPRLRRFCIPLQLDLAGPSWRPSALEALGKFEHLEEAFIGYILDGSDTATFESDMTCLEAYHSIQSSREDDRLWRVGIHRNHSLQAAIIFPSETEWETLVKHHLDRICVKRQSGGTVIIAPDENARRTNIRAKFDYHFRDDIRAEVKRQRRSFKQAAPPVHYVKCIYWYIKHVGGSEEWARNELIPAGLLSLEDLNDSTACSHYLEDEVMVAVCDPERVQEWKDVILGELQYLKRKKDFEAKHGAMSTLYDALYPGEGLVVSEDVC